LNEIVKGKLSTKESQRVAAVAMKTRMMINDVWLAGRTSA
jgi:hypothetical protein